MRLPKITLANEELGQGVGRSLGLEALGLPSL